MKSFNFNLKSFIIGLGVVAASHSALASPASEAMLEKLKKGYPNIPFSQVNDTPVPGIYEALFGTDVLYVESSGVYFFPTMVNMVTKANLGDERRAELNKIDFSELPLADAIKTVHGNGKRKMAVFADPNCGYCKKLEVNLEGLTDVTIYTFALGILGPDSTAKATTVNCSTGDKSKLWRSMMVEGGKPVVKECGNGTTAKNLALFQKFGFQGTPAIVFQNGSTLKGYAENARLEEMLAKK